MAVGAIASDSVTVALVGGLITLAIAALQLRRQDKSGYVDDLEAWVAELKAKNVLQDAAIAKLELAVDRCERERLQEKSDHQQQLFNLWAEINRLKGSMPQ